MCPWLAQKNVLATHAYSLSSLMMPSHRQGDRTAKMVASRRWAIPLDWVGLGRGVLFRFDWVLYIYPDILKTKKKNYNKTQVKLSNWTKARLVCTDPLPLNLFYLPILIFSILIVELLLILVYIPFVDFINKPVKNIQKSCCAKKNQNKLIELLVTCVFFLTGC